MPVAALDALTPLVGRDEELDLLLRRWSQAKDGEGQVVLLSGEPGIGKSRILSALRERLETQGVQALRFQCSPYYVNSAFWPIIDKPRTDAEVRSGRNDGRQARQARSAGRNALRPEAGRRSVRRCDPFHSLGGALRDPAHDAAEAEGRDAADLGRSHRSGRPRAAQRDAVRGCAMGRPHHPGGAGSADRPGENRSAAGGAHPPAGVSVTLVRTGACRRP